MKKLKHIIVLLTLAAIALCACSRETPLQRALSTIKSEFGIDLARQNGVELPAAPDGTPFAYKSENQGLNRVFLLYYSTENTAYLITLDA